LKRSGSNAEPTTVQNFLSSGALGLDLQTPEKNHFPHYFQARSSLSERRGWVTSYKRIAASRSVAERAKVANEVGERAVLIERHEYIKIRYYLEETDLQASAILISSFGSARALNGQLISENSILFCKHPQVMIMQIHQAKGYYLEEIVRELMRKSKFIDVKTGNIEGRGADHQIDSYGNFMFTVPFVHPVRLISEVKWFSRNYKVQLDHMRSFVGVMIDISQNYFVPRAVRSAGRNVPTFPIKERYTDSGAFFSATGFSWDAQNYAWAHGIYLVPFSNSRFLQPILNRVELLLGRRSVWSNNRSSKSDIINMARSDFKRDSELSSLMQRIFAYIGILDGIYPVVLLTDREFRFNPREPDDVTENNLSFDQNTAFKEGRIEREGDVSFDFRFGEARFSFSLSMTTAAKIIQAIESTYGGEAFASLDIPIVLGTENERYRRIFRIHLALPYKSDMIRTLKETI
jgi:hypothetical protein